MGVLLGYVVDIVVGAVMNMKGVDLVMKERVIRALNKVVWIQNDLFAWHYLPDVEGGSVTPPHEEIVEEVRSEGGCPFSH